MSSIRSPSYLELEKKWVQIDQMDSEDSTTNTN